MKTASPETLDLAPNDLPWKTGPSYARELACTTQSVNSPIVYSDGKSGPVVRDGSSPRLRGWHLARGGDWGRPSFRDWHPA